MKINASRSARMLLTLTLAGPWLPTPARSQETSAVAMDEVVVTDTYNKPYGAGAATTATKTKTLLRDIPASIQVVPEKLMEDQGAVRLEDTLKNVAGATQSSSSNYGFFNNFLIRGLNVTFLRDGVPDGPTINGYARTLTDVERVEILKGPGSALYGSLSPGGTINLVTKQPMENPYYTLSQMAGSFNTWRTLVDASGPLGAPLSYRLNGSYYRTDGFRDLANETWEILPRLAWKPADDQSMTVDFGYRRIEQVADPLGIPFRGNDLLNVDREKRYYTPFGNTEQDIYRGAVGHVWNPTNQLEIHNNLVFMKRDLLLLRNSGGVVAAGSTAMTARALRRQADHAEDWVYQIEPIWKTQTGPIRHTLLAGFEYQYHGADARRDTANLPNITNVFNPSVPETSLSGLNFAVNFDRRISVPEYGVYVQDQAEFGEHWKARIGGRGDLFEFKNQEHTTSVTTKRSDKRFSPQAGLVYQPVKSLSFYGGYSRSHLAPFTTESTAFGPPESATQYEVGAKTDLIEGKVSLDLALYHVTRKDFLVTINSNPVPVGAQRSRGLELNLVAQLLAGWNMTAAYAATDAQVTELPSDPLSQGLRPTGVPRHTATLWTTYEIQNGPVKGLGFGGGPTYRSAIFQDQQNLRRVPSYTVGDLVAFYRRGRWEAQVNIFNVTDAAYFRNAANNGAFPGDPLSVQGTVRMRY